MENTIVSKPKASPKDVFMHLLMIAMLYVSTIMFCVLWFNYINFLFPDALNYYYQGISDEILQGMATLIVVFPVFILLSWLLGKDMIAEPEKRKLGVRKWLVYLTLFIAAIAIIVEVVRLVYNFLYGETAISFYLKIFVVLVVAVSVFGYYLWDVRRKAGDVSKMPKTFAWTIGVIMVASIAYGFFLIGSPAHQRDLRFDTQRVNDLQSIQYQAINYWQKKNALPAQLSDLNDSLSGFVLPTDPETKGPYQYTATDPLNFELCATFKAKSIDNGVPQPMYVSAPMTKTGIEPKADSWSHEAGRVCYKRTIDPAIYTIDKPVQVIVNGAMPTVGTAVEPIIKQ